MAVTAVAEDATCLQYDAEQIGTVQETWLFKVTLCRLQK